MLVSKSRFVRLMVLQNFLIYLYFKFAEYLILHTKACRLLQYAKVKHKKNLNEHLLKHLRRRILFSPTHVLNVLCYNKDTHFHIIQSFLLSILSSVRVVVETHRAIACCSLPYSHQLASSLVCRSLQGSLRRFILQNFRLLDWNPVSSLQCRRRSLLSHKVD